MTTTAPHQSRPAPLAGTSTRPQSRVLQRCACGGTKGPSGECAACRQKRLARKRLQASLRIGPQDDVYEREADRIADAVMRAPSGTAPLVAPLGVQRVGTGGAGMEAPASVDAVLASPGRPLDAGTRSFMEARMGHDFSGIRIHTDARAASSARAVGARAYTVGRDIAFGAGEYAPGTREGRRLLAHELVHTVQQQSVGDGVLRREVGNAAGAAAVPTLEELGRRYAKQIIDAYNSRPAGKPSWRHFWRAVIKRFLIRGATAATLAVSDGPLPFGELLSLGLTAGTVIELLFDLDNLWRKATYIQARDRARAHPQGRVEDIVREDEDVEQGCVSYPVKHLGHDVIHNTCADEHPLIKNINKGMDYYVSSPEGTAKHFDALGPDRTLWEVKTETDSSYRSTFLRKRTLEKYTIEAIYENNLAKRCNFKYAFAVAHKGLYEDSKKIFLGMGIRLVHVPECI